jgi:phage tail sheath gpL-like
MADSTIGNVRYPLVQIAFDSSQAGPSSAPKYTLLIGQVTTDIPGVIVQGLSNSLVNALCGSGSHLAMMYANNVLNDPTGTIFLLPLPDAEDSTAAAGSYSITGPATGNGTLVPMVMDIEVPVGVISGQTGAQIATNMVAAINAMPGLPVTAAIDETNAFQVDLTAKNKGTLGNRINLSLNYYGLAGGEQLPSGLTVAITAMSGGATDPSLAGVAALVADKPYRFILHPYSSEPEMEVFAAMMSFQGGRWDPTRGSWGGCFTARQDLAANLLTYGPSNNDSHSTVMAYETGSPTPPWKWVAAVIGAATSSMRGDNNMPPQRPTQFLQVQGVLAPNTSNGGEDAWSALPEQNSLLGVGLGTTFYSSSGGVFIQRMPTTYQTNAEGQPSQAYYDTEDMYLLMAQSDYLLGWYTSKYPQVLIADTGSTFGSGLPIVTTTSLKCDLVAAYTNMQQMGWVDDVAAFTAACTVVQSPTNPNGVSILFTPFNIEGLRQVGITNQFRKFNATVLAAQAA